MKRYIGIDVHSKKCMYVCQDKTGQVMKKGEFLSQVQEIKKFAEEMNVQEDCEIGMETGSVTHFVAKELGLMGAVVKVIDAKEVRDKCRSKRQKSDYRDAYEIADGIRRDAYVKIIDMPDEFEYAMRDNIHSRRHFLDLMTSEVNAIKADFRQKGLGHLYKALSSEAAFSKLLAHPELDNKLKKSIQRHYDVWKIAAMQVKLLDEERKELNTQKQADYERLKTIPGVGDIVASTFLAYVSRPGRFLSAKHIASYTGLIPQTYHSGDKEKYGHITKTGPSELRAMLCQAAQHARRPTHPFYAMHKRLTAKKGYKVAIVAIAHRLSRVMWAMLKNGSAFDVLKIKGKEHAQVWAQLRERADVAMSMN